MACGLLLLPGSLRTCHSRASKYYRHGAAVSAVTSATSYILLFCCRFAWCARSHFELQSYLIYLLGLAGAGIPILEVEIKDPAVGQGYCESKWISENIITAASKQTTLIATIARLGQLTGSSSGAWKSNEWFPLLIKSSQIMGCLPTDRRVRDIAHFSCLHL